MAGKAGRRNWTAEEDAALRKHYPWHTSRWPEWPNVLPGRGTRSIQARANRIGIKKINREWTEEQDAQLAKAVGILCKNLHKGPESIAAHIKTLRLYGEFEEWKDWD